MKRFILATMVIIPFIFLVTPLYADDDIAIFNSKVSPDALILLDMSGSMTWCPDDTYQCCANYPDPYNPYCIGLSKIGIARSVINDLLDDNDDGSVNHTDEASLNVRLGYMRFWNSYNEDDNNPKTGSIIVLSDIGASYSNIYNNVNDGYVPVGGTPLAASIAEAKKYFTDYVNPADTALECRIKYVILVTDGADTWACGGYGSFTTYQMRMKVVLMAEKLYEAGIKLFTVGFGATMPSEQQRTLNWAARYGGTDNPSAVKSGDPSAYDITTYLPQDGNPCNAVSTAPECYYDPTKCEPDPGNYPLGGYAFLAANASDLSTALKKIISSIRESSYTFSSGAVSSVRLVDRDVLYMPSMTTSNTQPWFGNIKAYQLDEDGTVPVDQQGNPSSVALVWDAAQEMKNMSPGNRKIYTSLNGSSDFTAFIYDNISNSDLGLSGGSVSQLNTTRAKLINHIRGVDAYDFDKDGNTTEERGSKLGDFFHSNAVISGAPSTFFKDDGYNGTGGFYESNKSRKKVILVGANDGMLHAFYASDGTEAWGFIPPSLLKSLKSMIPTSKVIPHIYYVDSTPKVADVWFDLNGDNIKTADEWRTVLICGLRNGGKQYFALNITNTENPKFMWEFPKSSDSTRLNLVGQSWSEPAIGRVKIDSGGTVVEKWVAFIGGGQESSHGTSGRCFFVVDIQTGNVIWEFCYDHDADHLAYPASEKASMDKAFPAPPTAVDTDLDGYVNKVYIGDQGGQMWIFDVSNSDTTKWKGYRLFRAPAVWPEKVSIYSQPAVAFDNYGIPWVFFGTGDREDPNGITHYERFYAVVDDGKGNYPRTEGDLTNRSGEANNTYARAYSPSDQSTKRGWYIKFDTKGEKVLSKPSVFNRLVYFTTYTPDDSSGHTETCSQGGTGKLYIVEYLSAGGALEFSDASYALGHTSARSKLIGMGTLSAPVITVNLKGQAVVISGTVAGQVYFTKAPSPGTNKQTLYWREITR